MRDTNAAGLEATIRTYFDGCNEADAAKIMACMEPDAVHYFPAGAPQGTFVGAQAIADGWLRAVANLGSIWTIDRIIVDATRLEAVIEWTHFKPKQARLPARRRVVRVLARRADPRDPRVLRLSRSHQPRAHARARRLRATRRRATRAARRTSSAERPSRHCATGGSER